MTIKQKLSDKPGAYVLKNIIAKHADGVPLTCDEHNFLDWHQKSLSNQHVDSAAAYYLKHHTLPYSEGHSFLLPHEILNKDDIDKLKKRLKIMLSEKGKNVELKFTSQQFLDFRKLNYSELILFHGNHFLTGAPFFPGGIPHIIFFQWGNLFGVAKYVMLAEERALKSNVLIYFEDMQERLIDTCVEDYKNLHSNELKNLPQQQNIPQPQNIQTPENTYTTPTPTLSLSRNKEKKGDD